jgi:plasmid stabilization system protein ParE
MTRELVLSTLALADLAAARGWYNDMRAGLGEDLVLGVEHVLGRIVETPVAFPEYLPDVRRALVRRFPYGVFYRVRPSRIEVEAVFHLRADPSHLPARLHPAPVPKS